MKRVHLIFATLALIGLCSGELAFAQTAQSQENPSRSAMDRSDVPVEYRIGKDDLVQISVFEVPELSVVARVSASGTILLPLIGPVQAAGHSSQELAREIEEALRKKYLKDPHATVLVTEYASQPIPVLGAVKAPGIYQMKGEKLLLDMIALAQGIDQSNAGNMIQVSRAKVDNGSVADPASSREILTIDMAELFENGRTELNIPIRAGDVITVQKAGSIFVVGEVSRPNEFVLRNGRNVTVAQAVALANGFTNQAKKKACLIIRYRRDGSKQEIPVNAEQIFSGKKVDVTMLPNDILFVPANKVKTGLLRALDSTIAIVSGRLIYGL